MSSNQHSHGKAEYHMPATLSFQGTKGHTCVWEENALLKNPFKDRMAFLEHLHCYYLLINLCFLQACEIKLHGRITQVFKALQQKASVRIKWWAFHTDYFCILPTIPAHHWQAQQHPENRLWSRHDQEHHSLALSLQTVRICFASAVSNAALTIQDHLTFSIVSAVL